MTTTCQKFFMLNSIYWGSKAFLKNIFHSCKQERHVPGKQSSPCVSNSLCYPSSPTLNPTSTRALWRALSSVKWEDPKEECWRWKPDHQESQRTDNQKPYQPRGFTVLWGQHVWFWASLVAQLVNSLPAMQETQVQSLAGEDPLEKEMAIHSRILAWRIPWTEEPGGL